MRIRAAVLTAVLVLTSGCGDAATEPPSLQEASGSGALLGGVLGTLDQTVGTLEAALVSPLHRSVPLASPVSWSFTAGPNGTVSSHSATGLTINVPKGALKSTVTITVTALAGSPVAYGFAPHGLVFAKNVLLTQDLSGVDVGLLDGLVLLGAHFPGDEPEITDGLALVDETVAARLNLLGTSVSFPIRHFSGWIVATGRSDGEDSGAQ